jgi:hypothetical protein
MYCNRLWYKAKQDFVTRIINPDHKILLLDYKNEQSEEQWRCDSLLGYDAEGVGAQLKDRQLLVVLVL